MLQSGHEKSSVWYTSIAQVLEQNERYEDAFDCLDNALSYNSTDWLAIYRKAWCLNKLERSNHALPLMRQSAELQPDNIVGTELYHDMKYEQAATEYDTKNLSKAVDILSEMLVRNPINYDCVDTYIRCRAALLGCTQDWSDLAGSLYALQDKKVKRAGGWISGLSDILLNE